MDANKYKKVKQVLWIILFANLAVAALKVVFGMITKSASMTADGFHSLSDGSANIVGLVGIQLASKPEDQDHPYGHKKYENLAGLLIAGMLFIIGCKIIIEAIERFANPVIPDVTTVSLVVLIGTLCINTFVSVTEHKKGRELSSQILISDAIHTRSDIYVSVGVLITLICIKQGVPAVIDPIVSLIVAAFIIHAAYEIFKETSGVLVDRAAADTEKIRNIVLCFEQVKETHQIRSRGSKNDLHIDLHIEVDPNICIKESHELVHNIEEMIKMNLNHNTHVIIHTEPYSNDENQEEPVDI